MKFPFFQRWLPHPTAIPVSVPELVLRELCWQPCQQQQLAKAGTALACPSNTDIQQESRSCPHSCRQPARTRTPTSRKFGCWEGRRGGAGGNHSQPVHSVQDEGGRTQVAKKCKIGDKGDQEVRININYWLRWLWSVLVFIHNLLGTVPHVANLLAYTIASISTMVWVKVDIKLWIWPGSS